MTDDHRAMRATGAAATIPTTIAAAHPRRRRRARSVVQELCRWWIDLPDTDLAYLVEGTPKFLRYIA